jgi:hypothetical protein
MREKICNSCSVISNSILDFFRDMHTAVFSPYEQHSSKNRVPKGLMNLLNSFTMEHMTTTLHSLFSMMPYHKKCWSAKQLRKCWTNFFIFSTFSRSILLFQNSEMVLWECLKPAAESFLWHNSLSILHLNECDVIADACVLSDVNELVFKTFVRFSW